MAAATRFRRLYALVHRLPSSQYPNHHYIERPNHRESAQSITSFPNVPATCLCQSGSDNSSVNYLSDQYCISNEPSVGDTDATDDTHSAISLSTNMQPDGSSRSKSSSMTGLPVSLATASCRNKMSPAPNARGKRSTDSEKRPLRSSSINSARHASRMAIQSPA